MSVLSEGSPASGAEPEGPGDAGAGPEEFERGAEAEPTDRVRRPVRRPADRTARPAWALAAGACFSAVRAAASAAIPACWTAALAWRLIQRPAVSGAGTFSVADWGAAPAPVADRGAAPAPVLGSDVEVAPVAAADPMVDVGTAGWLAAGWFAAWAVVRAEPRGGRTVTTVLVSVASRKSPTAPNSMMMMPETSGLIWGRMGARAKTTATMQTAWTWRRRGTTRTRPSGPLAVMARRANTAVPATSRPPRSTCSDRSARATAASNSANCRIQKGTTRRPSFSPGSVGAA